MRPRTRPATYIFFIVVAGMLEATYLAVATIL
jgi:hypothetical protein